MDNHGRALGRAVRDRRRLLGLSQTAAAERVGLTAKTWRSVEHGATAHRHRTMIAVLQSLRWNVEDLGEFLETGAEPRSTFTPSMDQLVDHVRAMSARDRSLLADVLDLLARYVAGR